jgi:isopenicillin-N epimerase
MSLADHWALDRRIRFLNHGSFGACPIPVMRYQRTLRERMERQPVQFFVRDLEGLLDAARARLAGFLDVAAEDLAWVPNATTGVNAVLRSLPLSDGDELLVTDHAYNACRNAVDFVAARAGAGVVVAEIPFPIDSPDRVVEAVLERATSRTRLAVLDHVTSPTGLVMPIERLVAALDSRGVDVLVDGAHAPGMLELDVSRIGAAYYTGNCHKWLCAPKGAGFLHVRPDRQERVRPVTISHGANSDRVGRSRFLAEFDWVGTDDPTAYLSVSAALRFLESLFPGGWSELRRRNRETVLAGRELLCRALDVDPPCPEEMIGSLASVPLADGSATPSSSPLYTDPLQDELLERWGIEVPVVPWPEPPARLVRISAQAYNELDDYRVLAEALERRFRG